MHKVLFLGRKQIAADALGWLCDQPGVSVVAVVTDSHLPISATRDLAQNLGIPVLSRQQIEKLAVSQDLRFDITLSVLFWQKIRAPILENSRKGVINFHPAPLPEYKGTGGYNIAILNDHAHWGVSAHYVDDDIDTGPIIKVSTLPVDRERETAKSLEQKCRAVLLSLFKDVVKQALEATSLLDASPNQGGNYISRQQMEEMKRLKPGDDVARKIRAFWFPPYDGAYVMIDGIKCTLIERSILQSLADPTVGSLFSSKDDI